VSDAVFAGQVDGLIASGLADRADLVITGYFASPGQVAAAAGLLDHVTARCPKALRLVDPILGDEDRGLYVAQANAWELERLTGIQIPDAAGALAAARSLGRPVLVSSIPAGSETGVLWADAKAAWLATHPRLGQAPKGTGDLLAALFAAALVEGRDPEAALGSSVGNLAARLAKGPEDLLDDEPATDAPGGGREAPVTVRRL
jgi:pyridoxine kinase